LIVEDNKINRKLLQKYLEKLKIKYATAENGFVALEILKTDTQFDAIFLDLHMPVLGGIETAQKIKADHMIQDHTRIVAITATISETDIETCYEMGIEKILKKPYSFFEIEEICRK
jgi:CheY-like chemotaxis protein